MMAVSMNDARRCVLRSYAEVVEPHKYLSATVKLHQMGTGLWISEDTDFETWLKSSRAKLYLTGE